MPAISIEDPIVIAAGVDPRLLEANGIRVVSPPYPVATIGASELDRCRDDSQRFLTALQAEQRTISTRYGVDVLVVPAGTRSARQIGRVIVASSTIWVVDLSGVAPSTVE